MKKKLIIFLTISFLVFLSTLYFYREKQKKIENYIKQVETISSDIEESELKEIDLDLKNDEEILTWDDTKSKEKLIEEMIANQLADINELDSFSRESKFWAEKKYQKLYLQELKKNNLYLAIKAIKRILKTTKHKDVWYKKIVDLYIKIWDFKSAEEYSKKLLKIDPTKENLHNHLYIRFQNLNFFDEKEVKEIQSLVSTLYRKKVISFSEFKFYNFLIELLSNWNTESLDVLLDDLIKNTEDPSQKQLLVSIKNDLQIYKNTKGTPLYYFKSLVALDLLKFGYFGLARNIAERVYIENSSYILPKQILAYSYFFMGDYKNSIKYFKELKESDNENNEDYTFFMGVAYYWMNKYDNSLLFLDQISDTYPHYQDVLRYKLLSYIKLEDKNNVISTIKKLADTKLTYIDYYNIFKYLLADCLNCYRKDWKLVVKLIRNCYKDVDKEHQYVCWYWKASFYYKLGNKKYAAKYYKLLTKYFQDPYIYDILAKYYEDKWDKKRARYFYLKELLYTSKEEQREKIKKKIKDILMNKK